jgi:hypothetical protein
MLEDQIDMFQNDCRQKGLPRPKNPAVLFLHASTCPIRHGQIFFQVKPFAWAVEAKINCKTFPNTYNDQNSGMSVV